MGAPSQPCLLGLLSVARGSVKEPVVFDSVQVRACTSACVYVCACMVICVCACVFTYLYVLCACVCACVY